MPTDDQISDDHDAAVADDADHLKELRAKARKADKLEAELRDLRKKDAFREAKVNLDTAVGKFFMEHYAGELDTEAIQAEAGRLGLLGGDAPAPPVEPERLSPDEQVSTAERQALATGAHAEEGRVATPDPQQVAIQAAQDAIAMGRTQEDALAAGVGAIMQAAEAGDLRATWDPTRRS